MGAMDPDDVGASPLWRSIFELTCTVPTIDNPTRSASLVIETKLKGDN